MPRPSSQQKPFRSGAPCIQPGVRVRRSPPPKRRGNRARPESPPGGMVSGSHTRHNLIYITISQRDFNTFSPGPSPSPRRRSYPLYPSDTGSAAFSAFARASTAGPRVRARYSLTPQGEDPSHAERRFEGNAFHGSPPDTLSPRQSSTAKPVQRKNAGPNKGLKPGSCCAI